MIALLRLGLPFVICAFTVIPIAYYAISLREHPEIGFTEFWWKTITVGPWPSGPVWFLWVLLAFDLVACAAVSAVTHLLDSINRLSLHGYDRPAEFFLVLFAVTAVALRSRREFYFGAGRWFEFGPFSVQREPRAALCRAISLSAPASAPRISIAGCWRQTAGWRSVLGLGGR